MTTLNFNCNKCNASFVIDVEKASFKNGKLSTEEKIICPDCGNLKSGEYSFPENLNKTAVGELYFDFVRKEKIKINLDKKRKKIIKDYHPGQMILYEDVFDREEPLSYILGDKKYYLFDSYCVIPNCYCTDVALNFIDKEDKREIKTPSFSFVLNYETKNIGCTKDIDEKKAKDIVESFTQETLMTLRERDKKLKEELNDEVIEILKKYPRENLEFPKRKIGRNEPCPCGSGIKYKKCCLNKI